MWTFFCHLFYTYTLIPLDIFTISQNLPRYNFLASGLKIIGQQEFTDPSCMINRENELPIFCYFKHNRGKEVLHNQLWSPKLLQNNGGKGGMGRKSIVKLHGFNCWFVFFPHACLLAAAWCLTWDGIPKHF